MEQGSYNLFRVHSLNFYLLLHRKFLATTQAARASLTTRRVGGKSKWLFLRLTRRPSTGYYLRNFLILMPVSRRSDGSLNETECNDFEAP